MSNIEYINFGSGIPTSVNDILQEIEIIINMKLNVKSDLSKFRKDETAIEYCDNKKLQSLTGWKPMYNLHDGLKETIEAFFSEK